MKLIKTSLALLVAILFTQSFVSAEIKTWSELLMKFVFLPFTSLGIILWKDDDGYGIYLYEIMFAIAGVALLFSLMVYNTPIG